MVRQLTLDQRMWVRFLQGLYAGVIQGPECHVANVNVAGSNPATCFCGKKFNISLIRGYYVQDARINKVWYFTRNYSSR